MAENKWVSGVISPYYTQPVPTKHSLKCLDVAFPKEVDDNDKARSPENMVPVPMQMTESDGQNWSIWENYYNS